MECYCYLRNVQLHGPTPYERRLNSPSEGPIIPFGAKVKFHLISSEDQGRLHQFGMTVLPGIFM